jgi:ring-1,2-phenylacetyl-CoA epoxidase subunit PaaC
MRSDQRRLTDPAQVPARDELLAIGDDALIAAQRLSEWCARAPEMEEDVALANIALDQLGVARLVLSMVDDEDELAFRRTDREFHNCLLVELPNGDFAVTIGKLLFLSAFQLLRYIALSTGEGQLADISAKARKESAYHLDHATLWTIRLGDGTDESHRRMQDAVDGLWPYTHELFEGNDLRESWLSTVEPVLATAMLDRPADGWIPSGGRSGLHTEHLSYLLAEMQVLHRAHPGARW